MMEREGDNRNGAAFLVLGYQLIYGLTIPILGRKISLCENLKLWLLRILVAFVLFELWTLEDKKFVIRENG